MKRDFRIKKNSKGEFRYKLFIEHFEVEPDPHDADLNGKRVEIKLEKYPDGEDVLGFLHRPVKIPYMNWLFHTRIKDPYDKRLFHMVMAYMYLNPGIDGYGLKKLTSHLLMYNVVKVPYDGIAIKEKPAITFEELHPLVLSHAAQSELHECDLISQVLVAYSKDSKFNRTTKSKITRAIVHAWNGKLLGDVIHNTVCTLVDEDLLLQITKPRIIKKTNASKLSSVNTLSKHIRQDTTELMNVHNKYAPFRTQASREKYTKFLELPENLSNRMVSAELGISLSTVKQFRDLKDD